MWVPQMMHCPLPLQKYKVTNISLKSLLLNSIKSYNSNVLLIIQELIVDRVNEPTSITGTIEVICNQ